MFKLLVVFIDYKYKVHIMYLQATVFTIVIRFQTLLRGYLVRTHLAATDEVIFDLDGAMNPGMRTFAILFVCNRLS